MASVIIIEDEPEITDYIKMYAEDAGYKVFTADSVQGALAKCRNQRYDLILLDLHLKHSSGEDVVDKVRVPASLNATTPIIIISGKIESEILSKVGKKVNGALVKPFSPENLQKLFAKYMPE